MKKDIYFDDFFGPGWLPCLRSSRTFWLREARSGSTREATIAAVLV